MGVPENIDALLVKFDITQDHLARIAGVTPGAVTGWRKGSTPRDEAVENICNYFNIKRDDLLSDNYGLAAKEHEEINVVLANAKSVAPMDMVPVPLRGRVHAGPFTYPENLEAREETAMAPKRLVEEDPDLYACEVEGDCMNKVYPKDNCIIFVSPNKQPQNGSIAVVTLDGCDALVRRMYKTANTLVLSPESWNPEHKDIIITSDSDHTVEFGGKVVWYQAAKEME